MLETEPVLPLSGPRLHSGWLAALGLAPIALAQRDLVPVRDGSSRHHVQYGVPAEILDPTDRYGIHLAVLLFQLACRTLDASPYAVRIQPHRTG